MVKIAILRAYKLVLKAFRDYQQKESQTYREFANIKLGYSERRYNSRDVHGD